MPRRTRPTRPTRTRPGLVRVRWFLYWVGWLVVWTLIMVAVQVMMAPLSTYLAGLWPGAEGSIHDVVDLVAHAVAATGSLAVLGWLTWRGTRHDLAPSPATVSVEQISFGFHPTRAVRAWITTLIGLPPALFCLGLVAVTIRMSQTSRFPAPDSLFDRIWMPDAAAPTLVGLALCIALGLLVLLPHLRPPRIRIGIRGLASDDRPGLLHPVDWDRVRLDVEGHDEVVAWVDGHREALGVIDPEDREHLDRAHALIEQTRAPIDSDQQAALRELQGLREGAHQAGRSGTAQARDADPGG